MAPCSDIITVLRGAVAQLGERFPRTEEVVSSNLISSTKDEPENYLSMVFRFFAFWA